MKIVVVKIGSSSITLEKKGVDTKQISRILKDCDQLKKLGYQVILVSSGAIQSARALIQFTKEDLTCLQALSAIGQPHLFHDFVRFAKKYRLQLAQVLLTHDDLKNKKRYLNIELTLYKLLQNNVIPILNENDVVSFDEISLGDNDQLAAAIAIMMSAQHLFMLTGVDGIMTNKKGKNITKKVINYHDQLDDLAKMEKSPAGKGGITTKLMAVRKCTPAGIPVSIGAARKPNPIIRLLEMKGGSFFEAKKTLTNKKAKILASAKSGCYVVIDRGAFQALKKGASLLPIGIKKVHGIFNRGDCVAIHFQNKIVGAGIALWSYQEITKAKAMNSKTINEVYNKIYPNEFIHRNYMALKETD